MSNNNSILLIDPAFDPNRAPSCNLLIKIGLNSYSYAIIDKETDQVSAVFDEQECEDVAFSFAERLKTDSYLNLAYQQVKIATHTVNTIDIPSELYQEDSLMANTQFFADSTQADQLYTQSQSHFGFTTIFTLPKQFEQTTSNFTSEKKYQQNAGLLALAEAIADNALILDFTAGTFQALYLQNQQVVFQQNYEVAHAEEFNYYLLLMVKQLALNPATTHLYMSGIIHEGDDKHDCLLKYFHNRTFLSISNQLDQTILDDMPAHYYTSLLALDQCV